MKKLSRFGLKILKARIQIRVKRPRRMFSAVVFVLIIAVSGIYVVLNYEASAALTASKKLDNAGNYAQAKQKLESAPKIWVRSSIRGEIRSELARNKQLADVQSKLNEVKQLLRENKPQEAQKILESLRVGSDGSGQIVSLQKSVARQLSTTTGPRSTNGSTSSSASGIAAGNSGSGNGSISNSGGSPPPATGPLTSLNVVSFAASASAGTASTCNISDSVTFSSNGSGTVSTTWSLLSTKSTSQIDNPTNFTFAAAGNQSGSESFSGTQGLESGDSYRISIVITSASNPNISVTAGPITISNCAAPPALAAEQVTPFMTSITPGVPTVYEYKDGIFPNECSVQITTPYSVNSSGTVEAIVMATSGASVGYTYYDKSSVTAYNGSGNTSDTSYFRLPHLSGGGHYSIVVKLVEVSSPNTVFATTTPIDSACD